jgi:low temperature requirement protein LtrA
MRSRWFHAPLLHYGHGKRVSWLELFYDLIFVASIIQLGDFLSASVSLESFGLFLVHFTPLWLAWSGFTIYANRFEVDDFLHRTLVLVQMFAIGTMAICSHDAMNGEPTSFALAFSLAQAVIAALYLRAWIQVPDARPYARYWGLVFLVGSVAFLISAFVPTPWAYVLWGVGIVGMFVSPWSATSKQLTERYPVDMHHLTERYGLLTIIVLGESFVKVLTYLTTEAHGDPGYMAKGFFNLAITCCMWWVYFDDVAGSKVKEGRGSFVVWLFGHLPLAAAITAVGVAVKKAIKLDLSAVPDEKYRWLLCGSLALALLCVAIIDSVTERRNNQLSDAQRVLVRVVSAGAVLLLGQIGGSMTSATFLALLCVVMVAQVLFDMMMAPLEENSETSQALSFKDLHDKGERVGTRRLVPDIANTVRTGAPLELRRDLYLFFLEGSWTRSMLSFGFLYVALNALFAGLYLLDPGSILNNPDDGFGKPSSSASRPSAPSATAR